MTTGGANYLTMHYKNIEEEWEVTEQWVASCICDAQVEKIAELESTLGIYRRCLDRALTEYQVLYPDADGWPDGADSVLSMLEGYDKKMAELGEAPGAAPGAEEA